MRTTTALENELKQIVSSGRVLTSPAQLAGYDADGLGYRSYQPDAVVIPGDADELVRILQHCKQLDVPICMRGAGTSLSGGPVAAQGGLIVHTSNLRRVSSVQQDGCWCEAECGVSLSQLERTLQPLNLFYPPDPSSGAVCTIGGNVAMNAGGAHCFRYGVTSNYILGVEAVTSNGEVHRFGGPGGGRGAWREDWKRLMVGSEGTLAAFTRFWLRLLPKPEKAWTFRATYPDLDTAERAIHALVAHESFPVAIELMDPRCVSMVENSPMAVGLPKDSFMILTEIEGPASLVDSRCESVAEILRSAGSTDVVFSDDEQQRTRLWKARKVAGGLMGQISTDFLVQDAVIPKRALAELLKFVYEAADAAGVSVVNVFHAGDGNLHPNFLFDSRKPGEMERVEDISKKFMHRVIEVGGTLSGEHGIGNDKAAYMPLVFGKTATRLQLTVNRMFDAKHQLNPLKVFTSRKFQSQNAGSGAPGNTAAKTAGHTSDARCFDHFVDEIDGILCVPAESKLSDIEQRTNNGQLRFPLILDPDVGLRDQIAASGFTPASARFGPYCDNIVGMNWQLPNDEVIRLGERVVKTTTGYDLFRFILHSGPRYGRPLDYVIRLRPSADSFRVCHLRGTTAELEAASIALNRSCWLQWFDSADLLWDPTGIADELRIVVNCPAQDVATFESFVHGFATEHGLKADIETTSGPPFDGCPDFVIKTLPEATNQIARHLTSTEVLSCVASTGAGVVFAHLIEGEPTDAILERVLPVTREQESQLHEVGGEWHSRHVPAREPLDAELAWLSIWEEELASL